MKSQRRSYQFLAGAVYTAAMGIIAFVSVAGNSRYQTLHSLDVVRLMTAGAAIAVTIMMLVLFVKGQDAASENKT